MAIFLTFVGLTNIALGFAVAMQFGYGPPNLRAAWFAWMHEPFVARPREDIAAADPEPAIDTAALLPNLLGELLGGGEAEPDLLPMEQAYDNDFESVAALLSPDAPEAWDLNEKYVETSILRLNVAMMKSGARATEIDTRLRLCRGESDAETIQECLSQLKEDCEAYLSEQTAAAEKLHARVEELGELKSLGEEIENTNLDQAAQIETTLSNLRHMDFTSDLEAANVRLLQEIHLLRGARHRLRDSQEAAFLTVARYEKRLDKIERQLFTDPLSRLRNRIGLETALHQWWQENRHQTKQISAALFDLDHFGAINEEHGSLIADKAIYQLAQWLLAAGNAKDLIGRYAGQRFLVVAVDAGPRAAIKQFELIRQGIAQISLLNGEATIRLTACSGVTEVQASDAYEAVFERCEKALAGAKAAGPNTAYLSNGGAIEPIESPNLGPKPVEIVL